MKHRHAFLQDLFGTAAKAAFAVLCLSTASSVFGSLTGSEPDAGFLLRAGGVFVIGLLFAAFFALLAYRFAKKRDLHEHSLNS
ncbi:MAG: hypothetical protein LBT73_03425 [Tannerellaceae bacterium]|jgi:hypothetical protein|nr:hypothetical protein [Tannerellaceae bacterium]